MKNCLNCNEQINGRRDKKFCSDYCRSEFHNQNNRELLETIRKTNNRLKRNYSILRKFVEKEHFALNKSQLLEKGYHFDYFTGIIYREEAKVYCVYDLRFISLENNRIQIKSIKQTTPP